MLKTKITQKILNNKYIDVDSRTSYIDLNLLRICEFAFQVEKNKYNSFVNLYGIKRDSLFRLKGELNLKKLMYIKELRSLLNSIIESNFIGLYSEKKVSKYDIEEIKKTLIRYKIIKKNANIGYYHLLNFYQKIKDSEIFIKLQNINNDILRFEKTIKGFKEYYNQFALSNPNIYQNPKSKINLFDIEQIKKGRTTANVKAISFYYMRMIKVLKSKNPTYRENLNNKIAFGLISQNDINLLIESNLNQSFKDDSYKKVISRIDNYSNNLLNRYF